VVYRDLERLQQNNRGMLTELHGLRAQRIQLQSQLDEGAKAAAAKDKRWGRALL
jgi:hypothetical protein